MCAKGICWYNYITYFFVLLVSNKKEGLAIPLQLAEVGVSSPAKMKEEVFVSKNTHISLKILLAKNSPETGSFLFDFST